MMDVEAEENLSLICDHQHRDAFVTVRPQDAGRLLSHAPLARFDQTTCIFNEDAAQSLL